MKNIGFIGLGIMGKPMARNLMKAGYELTVFNRSKASVNELAKEGAHAAESIAEVAKCPIIITMLPDGPDVEKVVIEGGILENAAPGTLIIDMSSISPVVTKSIAEKLAAKGIRMLDAPVSGGEAGAINGKLAIMVGGTQEDFDEAKPIFDILGTSAMLIGPIGSGNTCKLTNQTIVACGIAAMCEGMMLAKKMGADPEKVYKAIRGGLAGSPIMDSKMPMILDQAFVPGFKIELHLKDLNNVVNAADAENSPTPLTHMVREMMESLKEKGYGASDHSGLAMYYQDITGLKIEP